MRIKIFYSMKKRPLLCTLFVACQLVLAFIVKMGYLDLFHNAGNDHPTHEDWSVHIFEQDQDLSEKYHVHGENNLLHMKDHDYQSHKYNLTTIAIGVAITSKGVHNVTSNNIRFRLPFFRTLLPSFCKTSTQGYSYQFYIAYDMKDPFFTQHEFLQLFTDTFYSFKKTMCDYVSELKLHLIQCSHNHKPAWAQNDAMMEAYLDKIEYYYRVNDDTLMKTPGWTEFYIKSLSVLHPPNVGVVGPKHYTGNTNILTYDFVHRTHIDIFGYYYPRIFTDWFADDWITTIYQPNNTKMLPQVKVLHTQLLGTRYTNQFGLVQFLKHQLNIDKDVLKSYIENRNENSQDKSDQYVIALTLPEASPDYVYGVIRNINLAKLYFKKWNVHVFAPNTVMTLNDRLYRKLVSLNSQINIVDSLSKDVPESMLNYNIIDNTSVKVFLLRNALGRFTLRDSEGVKAWLASGSGVYCVHDHPSHVNITIVPDLWGAKNNDIMKVLGNSIKQELQSYFSKITENPEIKEHKFLQEVIWPKVKALTFNHDSVSCNKWPNSHTFPTHRKRYEYLGKKYYAFEVPQNITDNSESVLILLKDEICTGQ